eukprot:9243033-Alexandrium_andersonii.AAC.1
MSGPAQPKRKRVAAARSGPVQKVRKAASDYLQALDKGLADTLGAPLADFAPSATDRPHAEGPARRRTLVLCQDEGSPGFALG